MITPPFQKNNYLFQKLTPQNIYWYYTGKRLSWLKNLSDGVIQQQEQTIGSRERFLLVIQVQVVRTPLLNGIQQTNNIRDDAEGSTGLLTDTAQQIITRFYLLPLKEKKKNQSPKNPLLLTKQDLSTSFILYPRTLNSVIVYNTQLCQNNSPQWRSSRWG